MRRSVSRKLTGEVRIESEGDRRSWAPREKGRPAIKLAIKFGSGV